MRCVCCGTELGERVLFCHKCGTRVVRQGQDLDEQKTVIYGFSESSEKPSEEVGESGAEPSAEPVEDGPEFPEAEQAKPAAPDTEISGPELPEAEQAKPAAPDTEISGPEFPEAEQAKPAAPDTEISGPEAGGFDTSNSESAHSGIVFCHECGEQNTEGNSFCRRCGKPLSGSIPGKPEKIRCHSCGMENDPSDSFCFNCGTILENNKTQNSAPHKGKSDGKKSFPILAVLIAAASVLALVLVVLLAKTFVFGSRNRSVQLFYIKDNGLMMYHGKTNVEVSDRLAEDDPNMSAGYYVSETEDGSKILFPRNYDGSTFDLCVKQLKRLSDEAEKIDSNVVEYRLIDNDKVAYIKESGERKLYISDFKGNSTKIDTDVESFWLSKDEKKILWKTESSDDNRLYYVDVSLSYEKVKIDSGVTRFLIMSDDLYYIYYMKDDSLYEISDLKTKNKIASDVEKYWSNKEDDKLILYYSRKEDISLSDTIIEDDMADTDSQMMKPDISDYQHKEVKQGFWGPQEKTVTDDSYYSDLEKYEEKLERDKIRDVISKSNEYEVYYSLIPGDEPVKLTPEIGWMLVRPDKTGMIYCTINAGNFEKIKLTSLLNESTSEIKDKIEKSLLNSAEAHINVFGEDKVLDIDLEDKTPAEICCDTKGRIAYISVSDRGINDTYDDYDTALYKTDYAKGKGELDKVCDDFNDGTVRVIDGNVYYINDKDKRGEGNLYEEDELIASDVREFGAMPEGNGIYYKTDVDDDWSGTLNIYDGRNSVKVFDDVSAFRTNKEGNIAFLTDYSSKRQRGDLKLYKNGLIINVDSDVNSIALFD